MPLLLQSMVMDDVPAFHEIVSDAFSQSLTTIFYPDGAPVEAAAHSIAAAQKQWADSEATAAANGTAPTTYMMKVTDTDLGANAAHDGIVGVAKWNVYPRGRSEEELRAEAEEANNSDEPPPPGQNVTAMKAFKKALRETKYSLFGTKPYMILYVLVTHPDHFRRGIGQIHLKWGQDLADSLGLPMYLEASAMGRPLYKRWGYREIMDIPFDGRDWGAKEAMTHFAMIRPATKAPEHAPQAVDVLANGAAVKQNGTVVNGGSIHRKTTDEIPHG